MARKKGYGHFCKELDPHLLRWEVRWACRSDELPRGRTVAEIQCTDLLASGRPVDLWLTRPGFEVELSVATNFRTMTEVWMGQAGLRAAIQRRKLPVHEPRELRRRLPHRFDLSPFAGMARL